ncbi:MAG: hypothetical protein JW937_05070 [Candidatus Omnitrophica bacterium]|nr:hypothetical protein [Candidatus Omnitrophota bacterium]
MKRPLVITLCWILLASLTAAEQARATRSERVPLRYRESQQAQSWIAQQGLQETATCRTASHSLERPEWLAQLWGNPDWAVVYLDESHAVLLKRSIQNQDFVQKFEIRPDLMIWNPGKPYDAYWGALLLGRLMHFAGYYPKAESYFLEAQSIRPNAWQPARSLAHLYLDQERVRDATEALRTSLRYHPAQADLQSSLGALLTVQGEWERALLHYRWALLLDPGRVQTAQEMEQVYRAVRDRRERLKW